MRLGISVCLLTLILVVTRTSQTVTASSLQAKTSQPHVLSERQMHEKGDTDTDLPLTVHGGVLPFRFSEGYLIMVEGQIGAQTNLKFILDTGATISIIDTRIADKIKLQRHSAESLSFDRKLNWEATTVPEVQFGQITAHNVRILVGRLAEYSDFAKKVDAIIGMDLLKLRDFSIDFDSKKIIFDTPQREYTPAAGEPLSDCLILEAQIQGQPVRLIVDTGFADLLLYEERLLKRVPALRTAGSPTGVSLGGRLQAKQAVLPDVVFGARKGAVSALLVQGNPPETLSEIDGVVGLTPLKTHRVHFDFVGRRLSWEPAAADLTIPVRVFNYAQAPPALLARAEREADRIFGKAGLKLVWLDCTPGHSTSLPQDPCEEAIEAEDIRLRIHVVPVGNSLQDSVFGFAIAPALATVYYESALGLAKYDENEFEETPIVLGCVIAHEIGHLLLGSNGHSDSGIMQARWDRRRVQEALMGAMDFTPSQARLIQAEIQRRMTLTISKPKNGPLESAARPSQR